MAEACLHFMSLPQSQLVPILNAQTPPLFNIGCGEDLTIAELATVVAETVGFTGKLAFDTSKPDGTPQKLLDISRTAELGWRASTTLHEGLKLAYKDFLAKQA